MHDRMTTASLDVRAHVASGPFQAKCTLLQGIGSRHSGPYGSRPSGLRLSCGENSDHVVIQIDVLPIFYVRRGTRAALGYTFYLFYALELMSFDSF